MTDPDRFRQVHRGTIVNVDAAFGVMCEDAEK
jgi:DNA-binding LytR/AlgR family response regulator